MQENLDFMKQNINSIKYQLLCLACDKRGISN